MSEEELVEQWSGLCLELPCTFLDHPFGPESLVFKVAGRQREKAKMYAIILSHHGELLLNLKCEPAIADQLRAEHELIIPGYHMNKKHWISLKAGLELQTLRELIEDSYDLVVDGMPKADKEHIAWQDKIAGESLD